MNWSKASDSEVLDAINQANRLGRGITVSAKWLKRIMVERRLMAKLAEDELQLDNPMEVRTVYEIRDRILSVPASEYIEFVKDIEVTK